MHRTFLALAALAVVAAPAIAGPGHSHGVHSHGGAAEKVGVVTRDAQRAMTPQQALARLKAGNERWAAGKVTPRDLVGQREATAEGQYPFATVVSCLDSRTSSEWLFDLGVGDAFNARVAGNIVNEDILGSLEFASKVAGSKLIAVIGHSGCGAVKGAVDRAQLGNLTGLLAKMDGAVVKAMPGAKERTSKDDALVQRSTEWNVRLTMQQIRAKSPVLKEMIDKGEIGLVGGLHDLESGKVTWLAD